MSQKYLEGRRRKREGKRLHCGVESDGEKKRYKGNKFLRRIKWPMLTGRQRLKLQSTSAFTLPGVASFPCVPLRLFWKNAALVAPSWTTRTGGHYSNPIPLLLNYLLIDQNSHSCGRCSQKTPSQTCSREPASSSRKNLLLRDAASHGGSELFY